MSADIIDFQARREGRATTYEAAEEAAADTARMAAALDLPWGERSTQA